MQTSAALPVAPKQYAGHRAPISGAYATATPPVSAHRTKVKMSDKHRPGRWSVPIPLSLYPPRSVVPNSLAGQRLAFVKFVQDGAFHISLVRKIYCTVIFITSLAALLCPKQRRLRHLARVKGSARQTVCSVKVGSGDPAKSD